MWYWDDGKGDSSNSGGGGGFRRWGGVDVVDRDVVGWLDSGSDTCGGGLRSLRIKRALVAEDGGGGSSLVGLDEREEMLLLRSLVGGVEADEGLMRKRRTPFMLKGTCTKEKWLLTQPTAGQETVLKRNGQAERQGNAAKQSMMHTPAAGSGRASTCCDQITRQIYDIYSTLPTGPINLRAALLERLDHQPGHPPKKGIGDRGVDRTRKSE